MRRTQKSEPTVTGYEHGFELRWEKSEIKKLLDSSTIPCEQFFVGNSGILASEPITSPYYQIFNISDFLTGSFEDLMDLGGLACRINLLLVGIFPFCISRLNANPTI
jgi:hypothetical protein